MGYILYTRGPSGLHIFDLLADWNADSVAAFLKLHGYEGLPLKKGQPFDGGSYGVGLCTDEHIGAQDLPITGSELIEKPDGSFVYRMTHEKLRSKIAPITARQLRLKLLEIDKLADVEPAIMSISDEPARVRAKIEWEYATEYFRDHPLVGQLGHAFGLSDEQLDQMFIEAALL